ncbi:hypothetical protein, partial [Spirosoma utsteinense]
MKTGKHILEIVFMLCLLVVSSKLSAQSSFSYLVDLNGDYASSVPPNTAISYVFTSTNDLSGCKYNWTASNSENISSGQTISTDVPTFRIVWNNVNGTASATVSTYNCSNTTSNGSSATYSAPIRYLGNIGSVSLNGSTSNPQNLGCGAQTVTLSVGAATNATNYNWNLSGLSGWSIINGQGTNTITATTSAGAGGTVQVTATRNDAPNTSSSNGISVTRPTLTNASLTGGTQGCYNQLGTYSLANLTSGVSTVWSASGPLSIAGSSATGVTINYGGNDGFGAVTAQITDGCNNTVTRTLDVGVGTPNISTINYDGLPNSGPVAANSGSTHYLNVVSSNSPSANYSLGVTNNYGDINVSLSGVNGGNAQIYVYGNSGNSSINVSASNVCGSRSAALIIYIPSGYRAAPNPAKESVAVTFTDTQYQEALPDELEIVSEKTMKSVRSVNVKEIFKKGGFQDSNKINFDIKDLPRGTYYLKVVNPRREKEKQTETVRLVF